MHHRHHHQHQSKKKEIRQPSNKAFFLSFYSAFSFIQCYRDNHAVKVAVSKSSSSGARAVLNNRHVRATKNITIISISNILQAVLFYYHYCYLKPYRFHIWIIYLLFSDECASVCTFLLFWLFCECAEFVNLDDPIILGIMIVWFTFCI